MAESLGKTLKKIREAKQFSVGDISERTRIAKKIIFNIEEDKLNEISSPFYAKGFVRSYSQFLGALEAGPVKEYLSGAKAKDAPRPSFKDKKPASDWLLRHKKQIGAAVLTVFCVWLVVFSFVQVGRFTKNCWAKHRARVAEKEAAAEAKPQPVEPQSAEPEKKAPPVVTEKKKEMFELEIEARYNTWMQLASDGQILFIGTLRKNEKDSWQAKDKIEIKLGNAGGVTLRLNGKDLGVPGKKREKKTIVVTKDGLTL